MATYRTTAMAISKDGELCIYPVREWFHCVQHIHLLRTEMVVGSIHDRPLGRHKSCNTDAESLIVGFSES